MDLAALADLGPALIAIGVLLLVSAFFSGTEVAMFSLRRVDREQLARSDRTADRLVHALISRPRRLIATVLIGNEVVNVSISSFMASVGDRVFAGRSELGIALLTTLCALPLLLLVGEITPKTIAIKTAPTWARWSSRPLWLFGRMVAPVLWLVNYVAGCALRVFGIDPTKPTAHKPLAEDEFKALVDAGNAEGEVDARERRLIHKVFEFGEKTAAQVMVGAADAFLLAYNLPLKRIVAEMSQRGLSRVPIYHKSRDNILGILFAKDLVTLGTGQTSPRRLGELLHEPLFVPRTMRLERLFEIFKERKTHMAIVVNEYGKFVGLITMEDLLEELIGPIRDEKEVRRQRTNEVARVDLGEEPTP
jgi:putative hemolysin